MGVQGLATFLDNHEGIYQEVKFSASKLVIDGSNLYYRLYFSSGLDKIHGGEYAAFESLIEKFIKALTDCHIKPYVVLDGGLDISNRKVETAVKKAEERIQRVVQSKKSGNLKQVLPRLADLVFIQTLARLHVQVAQCIGESDQEIAALASEWECPVLSDDSDFYIFDLPAGYLPLSHFQWDEVTQNNLQSFIPCKRFDSSTFCSYFKIQPQILPTFAALAGNDYVNLRKILCGIQSSAAGSKAPSYLEGLLCFLTTFQQPQDALETVLELTKDLSKDEKKKVLQKLKEGMKVYQLCPSFLSRFFCCGKSPEISALIAEEGLVPDWMLLPLAQARLSGDLLNVLLERSHLQRNSLKKCVIQNIEELKQSPIKGLPAAQGNKQKMKAPDSGEPINRPSVSQTSKSIRQVTYGLLLGSEKSPPVAEICREDDQLAYILVKPTFSRLSRRFKLSSLHEEEPSDRLSVLLDALEVAEASLSSLLPHLKLPVAVSCYWLKKTQPRPEPELLKALLGVISIGDMPRAGTNLQTDSCEPKPDMDVVVDAFDRWMKCLKDSIHLNQLLCFPLPEPDIARLFQGMLVHQLVHEMRTGGNITALLKSNKSSEQQYKTMLSVVCRCQKSLLDLEKQQKATPRPQQHQQPQSGLMVNLQQLSLQHEDEETEKERHIDIQIEKELQPEELVSVRTRYRTKERSNRCNKPELARKEECRGESSSRKEQF